MTFGSSALLLWSTVLWKKRWPPTVVCVGEMIWNDGDAHFKKRMPISSSEKFWFQIFLLPEPLNKSFGNRFLANFFQWITYIYEGSILWTGTLKVLQASDFLPLISSGRRQGDSVQSYGNTTGIVSDRTPMYCQSGFVQGIVLDQWLW